MKAQDAFAILRGHGQPWLFVVHAVQIASSPDMLRDLIRWTAYGERPPRPFPPRPPIREWKALYRRHRLIQDGIAAGMGLPADLSASDILDELRGLSEIPGEEIAAGVAELTTEEQEGMMRPFIGVPFPPDDATLRAMLDDLDANGEPEDDASEAEFDALLSSAAGQFYLRVWLPCWMLYREYPQQLLRAARRGDLNALDRLLRVDKHILGDPIVARVVAGIYTTGTDGERKQLTAALNGVPTVKLTDKAIRSGLGALISQLALLFRTSVTAPQIQTLFDRISKIQTGNPSDPAIPAGEAWSKAIQRQRTWPSLPRS